MNEADTPDIVNAKTNKPKHITRWVIILVLIIIVSVSSLVLIVNLKSNVPSSLSNASRSVNFRLFYPDKLPQGYSIDNSSISHTNNVVLFSFINPIIGTRIIVSEQPLPQKSLDLNDFYKNEFTTFDSIITPAGDGVIGNAGNNSIASILSKTTWIIVKGPINAGDDVRSLSTSMEVIK